jgi:citrate lyase subunit beta/citryl-CoA lyase
VLNAFEIGGHERVIAIAFGALDYVRNLGVQLKKNGIALSYPRAHLAIVARAAGIGAMDTPWFDLNDEEGLIQDATLARDLGFTGKLVIHPRQIEIVNEVFGPQQEEVALARKVIEAFEDPIRGKKGVISVEGIMIDEVNYRKNKELIEKYEAFQARSHFVMEKKGD